MKTRYIITLAAVAMLVLRQLFPDLLKADIITIALLIAAIIPWAPALVESAEFPGGWKVDFSALEERTQQLQKDTDRLQKDIADTSNRIDKLVIAAISPGTLGNLKKLNSGEFKPYFLGTGLSRELSYLENKGYISFKCKGIDDIPQNGHEPDELNLADFVEVTPWGKEYLDLRDIMEQKAD